MNDHTARALLSADYLPSANSFFTSIGIDYRTLFAEHIGLEKLQPNEEGFLDLEDLLKVVLIAQEQTNDPALGIKLGIAVGDSHVGLYGYIIANSKTVQEALDDCQRLIYINSTLSEIKQERGETVSRISHNLRCDYMTPEMQRLAIEGSIAICAGTLGAVAHLVEGEEFRIEIPLPPPENIELYESAFRHPIKYGCDECAIVLSNKILETEIPQADAELKKVLCGYAQDRLPNSEPNNSFISELKDIICKLLPANQANLANVAKQCHVSPRTLQRKLDDQEFSFTDLVSQVRQSLAEEYLCNRRMPLTEVAFLLGYSDFTPFSRAFKRWFNMTPAQYRKAQKQP